MREKTPNLLALFSFRCLNYWFLLENSQQIDLSSLAITCPFMLLPLFTKLNTTNDGGGRGGLEGYSSLTISGRGIEPPSILDQEQKQ